MYYKNNKYTQYKKPHILLFHDNINIKIYDPNNIKIDETSYKDILIY